MFRDKHHQMPAIICSIREILNLSYFYHKHTREYLEKILNYFQEEINNNRTRMDTHLTTSISKDQHESLFNVEYEDRPVQYNYRNEMEYPHSYPMAQFGKLNQELDNLKVNHYSN